MEDLINNKKKYYKYDVVVIGGGHAGCEAAMAAARIGVRTLLISINLDAIALMPCNSSVGGPGRGQLVREIDVLGAEMPGNVDKTFIHSRMLNTSKGPALRTLRAIVDKRMYFLSMKEKLENHENMHLKQGLVAGIKLGKGNYKVNLSDETSYYCKSIVIATGTFLRGMIFWGDYIIEAGRQGEINSKKLVKSLESMKYKFGRLRTETPPRIDKKTVDLTGVETQGYDKKPAMFSYDNVYDGRKQYDSYITYIDRPCIDYIIRNLKKSAIYKKNLRSESPKYCPSIEDKVKRFYKKERHPVFIQPEGLKTNEMYLHGLFTTFSEEIQEGLLKKIRGLENAVITRPGYGVEYDYLKPFQIKCNLESKIHKNIFFAGQINGTTGYEEAAAQGVIAGINAALSSSGRENLIINRQDGYLGILIDDIVLKGVTEPYRMLTSRNEFRLVHRHDNADKRMARFLKTIGLKEKSEKITKKYEKIEFAHNSINRDSLNNKNFLEDLRQDRMCDKDIVKLKKDFDLNEEEFESLIINLKYDIYLNRETERIKELNKSYEMKIPEGIDFRKIKNFSNEAANSFRRYRPEKISQATRLEGVRPTDILALVAYIKNVSRET